MRIDDSHKSPTEGITNTAWSIGLGAGYRTEKVWNSNIRPPPSSNVKLKVTKGTRDLLQRHTPEYIWGQVRHVQRSLVRSMAGVFGVPERSTR
ncbi:hypothetical protein BJY00DRAFT_245418 [Aspergillus carlsbadensis]|nr:hypothetical protein BJY00DRAFT_245418 [Aspergillus carlsbadensis]